MKKEQILVYFPGRNSREHVFNTNGIVGTLCALVLVLGLIIAGSAYVGLHYLSPYCYSGDSIKNKVVIRSMNELSEELDYTQAYLDSMVRLNNEIRLVANMPEHTIEDADLAIGGYEQFIRPEDASNDVERLDANVQLLNSKIAYELENYKSLYQNVQNYQEKLSHMPAISPLEAKLFYISSPYGTRTDPFTKKKKWHSGIDMAANRGTDVHATGDGKVISSYYSNGGYGNVIKIDHGYGYVTVYAHLNQRLVFKGDTVMRGDHIGEVGTTGRSTGPHLHYEIQKDKKTVNPLKYIWTDEKL